MAKHVVKATPANIEEVRPFERNALLPFLFHIAGAQVTIWAKDQRDAVVRFQAQTEGSVVFITEAEMERRRKEVQEAALNAALDVIDDSEEEIAA